MDIHLYTEDGPPKKVLWRPGEGRSVVLNETHYRPFTHVRRTVHLEKALTICAVNGVPPMPITTLSILSKKTDGLCRNLHVLWFGVKPDGEDEDAHDLYGNIEFEIPTGVMMHQWKKFYLVEMITAPTKTTTRILATNSDYSAVLPPYDPWGEDGPWRITPDGRHECLTDCRRYNGKGFNADGHILEFMIEITSAEMGTTLAKSEISFRNHEQGRNGGPHDCRRYGSLSECPTPFPRHLTARKFFDEHQRRRSLHDMATPRLSPSAEKFHEDYLKRGGHSYYS